MKRLNQINEYLSRTFFYLASGGTLIVLSVTFFNVIARYLFNSPFHWAEEVTANLVILIGFFPAATLLRNNWHVKFDLVSSKVETELPVLDSIFKIIIDSCGIVFAGLIVWQTWINIVTSWKFNMRESSLLGTPLWLPYSYMLIGSVLLLLAFGCLLLGKTYKMQRRQNSEPRN